MIELQEAQDGVAVLRMADGKANAMSLEFCRTLTARFGEIGSSKARAVVMTGSGGIFSAGVDLIRLLDGGAPYVREFMPVLATMFVAVFSCPKPVVAAINGHAVAGGCVLACAADRRLMAREGGRIGTTELAVGVPFPTVAIEIMRCAAAAHRFEEVIFGAAAYAPPEAVERGLVHEIVEPDALIARAVVAAKALAALPPAAFALTKRQTRQPALARIARDACAAEVEAIWTVPETAARIRDHVARTLRKA